MKHKWPFAPLGTVLTERREEPSTTELESGQIRIIEKISFNSGRMHFRINGRTKTGMILVRPGDLVVSGINAAKGAIAVYDHDAPTPAAATIHYGAYIPDRTRANVRFLWWMLRSRFFQELLLDYVPGGIKTELKPKRFLPIPVPMPPLVEQRRVVARIEGLAAQLGKALQLREGAALEVEALRKSVFSSVMLRGKAAEVELATVCEAIIDNLHSNPQYAELGVPCIRSPDVGWGTLSLATARRTSEQEYRRRTARGEPQLDDIVMVREGGGTGKCALVLPQQRFSLGQRVMMLRPNKRVIDPKFFLYQLLSPLVQDDQIAELSRGAASPHLNIGALRKFKLRLPSLEEQRKVVEKLDTLLADASALSRLQREATIALDALLPTILNRAFKGELV